MKGKERSPLAGADRVVKRLVEITGIKIEIRDTEHVCGDLLAAAVEEPDIRHKCNVIASREGRRSRGMAGKTGHLPVAVDIDAPEDHPPIAAAARRRQQEKLLNDMTIVATG